MQRNRVCSVAGCPNIFPTTHTKCQTHRKEADQGRGNATRRGYTTKAHRTFRKTIITRNPICEACNNKPSTIADHHPHSRKELIQLGLNPNDPQHGRALCHQCHSKATAANQPGGWNTN